LAAKLTGWKIDIKSESESGSEPEKEEEEVFEEAVAEEFSPDPGDRTGADEGER
jgi:transcription termination/antitermination protein NusA